MGEHSCIQGKQIVFGATTAFLGQIKLLATVALYSAAVASCVKHSVQLHLGKIQSYLWQIHSYFEQVKSYLDITIHHRCKYSCILDKYGCFFGIYNYIGKKKYRNFGQIQVYSGQIMSYLEQIKWYFWVNTVVFGGNYNHTRDKYRCILGTTVSDLHCEHCNYQTESAQGPILYLKGEVPSCYYSCCYCSYVCHTQGTLPPWILKWAGLESSGRILISPIGKTKMIIFFLDGKKKIF